MTLTDQVVKNIITRVIKSKDYRIEIVNLINAEFLQFAIDFFKKVVEAKLKSEEIDIGWYKKAFMDDVENLSIDDIAINSGLNKKTIGNMYGSTKREIVIDAADKHFKSLYHNIENLVRIEKEIDLKLTIKMKSVSVDLNLTESLIVINTLAVKRAALRGGLWSTAGKSVEKYLMLTLCELYGVSKENYEVDFVRDKEKKVDREVDFYLKNGCKRYRCEVKLMGKGNPESADAIFARKSKILVADTLSSQNKDQCDGEEVYWIALRDDHGHKRFGLALQELCIPYKDYDGELDDDLKKILDGLFKNK